MPRYFFHSANGERDLDQEGVDLPNGAAAQLAAVQYAGEMLRFQPQELWNMGHWRVEVTDTNRRLLFTIITIAVDTPASLPSAANDHVA